MHIDREKNKTLTLNSTNEFVELKSFSIEII